MAIQKYSPYTYTIKSLLPALDFYLVGAKVCQLEVEVVVQHTVLGLDVSVKHAPFMEIHDGEQGLREVVASQGFWKIADTAARLGVKYQLTVTPSITPWEGGGGADCEIIKPCSHEIRTRC